MGWVGARSRARERQRCEPGRHAAWIQPSSAHLLPCSARNFEKSKRERERLRVRLEEQRAEKQQQQQEAGQQQPEAQQQQQGGGSVPGYFTPHK